MNNHIVVRPASRQDGRLVSAFLAGLSETTRIRRFFNGLPKVSAALVELLSASTPSQVVLLALDQDVVIGHGMAVWDAEHAADLGIVIADAYQHQGIGSRLLAELTGRAAGERPTVVRCDVLSENYSTLHWLRQALPGIEFERTGITTTGHWVSHS